MKRLLLLFVVFLCFIHHSDAQWQQTNGPSGGGTIYSLAISGTNIFAGTWQGGVFLSTNNGNSWTAMNNGLTYHSVLALAISDTNIFVGTFGGGVFLSTNNGNNWTAMNNGLTNHLVSALAISGPNIFAGTDSGVFLSTNNGNSWTAVNNGLTNQQVSALAISGPNIFAGTCTGGVFLSTNNGNNWTVVSNGLMDTVLTLAISGPIIFASIYSNGVFLSTNNGNSWTAVNNGLPCFDIPTIPIFIKGTSILAGTECGVFLSNNNGNNWFPFFNGLLSDVDAESFANNEDYIFAGSDGLGVWKCPVSEIVGINQIIDNTHFTLSPNPLTSTSILRLNDNYQAADVSIIDMLGNEILRLQMTGSMMEINKGSLTNGIYFVKVTADGKQSTQKLVVQ